MNQQDTADNRELDEFLTEQRHAIFATNRKDGPPQLSPVWYVWDSGLLYVSTSADSIKARNVDFDPRITVCVDGGWDDFRYVAMSGDVEIAPYGSELQQEMRWRIIRKYHDSDEAARAFFDSSADEESIIIMLKPSRIIYKDMNG